MVKDYITNDELEKALNAILEYLTTKNKEALQAAQREIKLAKEIDYAIKTRESPREETSEKSASTNQISNKAHKPARMLILGPLSLYGELYAANGLFTIYKDDPDKSKYSHTNIYKLILRNADTHYNIYPRDATVAEGPWDFDTEFIKQFTVYPNDTVDTTATAWDSFQRAYTEPKRRFEFKSALWDSTSWRNTHWADYIITLSKTGELEVLSQITREKQEFLFEPNSKADYYLTKYLYWLAKFPMFTNHYWDEFILTDN